MIISRTLLAVTCAILLLTGCETGPALALTQESPKFSIESSGKFARLDLATQTAIICTGLQERSTQDGRLEVVANIKNRGASEIQVRVRCVFKDADGFATRDETPWQWVNLGDEATEAVRFTASNLLAKKYTVVVRSP